MREIKFRAWDTQNKSWVPSVFMTIGANDQLWIWDDASCEQMEAPPDVIKLMQFTGLFDRHGKEIWEGDVVRHAADKKYPSPVVWHRGAFMVQDYWLVGSFNEADLEVLGNLYENPELLKSQPKQS